MPKVIGYIGKQSKPSHGNGKGNFVLLRMTIYGIYVYIYVFWPSIHITGSTQDFVDSTRYGRQGIIHASTMVMPNSEMVIN